MAERLRLLCLASLAVLALAGSPALAAISFGDLEMTAESEPRGDSSHGYTEFRILIRHRGTETPRRVTLTMPGESFHGRGRGALQSISRTVTVNPGLTSVVSLYQPATPDVFGSGILVHIDGRREEKMLPVNPSAGRAMMHGYGPRRAMYYTPGFTGGSLPLVLMSNRVDEKFHEREIPFAGGLAIHPPPGGMVGPGGPGGGMGISRTSAINAQFIRSTAPITTWSNHWLGYTRYDGIIVVREDMEQLQRESNESRDVLQALWRYTELGGVLLVLGPGDAPVPVTWKRYALNKAGLNVFQVGFGQCMIAPDRHGPKWEHQRWEMIRGALNVTASPWTSSRTLLDLNKAFPVVDDLSVPVKGLFVLMVLFAIALGPVNLVVLTKRKKRIWMLWTVPALSAVTCLAVFSYMIVAEGWQGHARVGGITFLDESEHRATSLGRAAFYSPLTPGDGLRFSEDTEVFMQAAGQGSSSTSCAMDWTEGQHLSRGWVTARVPAHFALRTSETRRERLAVSREKESGSLEMVNALGVKIKTVWVADDKGGLWTAGDVPEGQRATLSRAGKPPVRGWPAENWRKLYGSDWIMAMKSATEKPEQYLGRLMYLAVVEGSPFHEQGLRGAKVRMTESVVIGLMAGIEEK
jgi:hypothetical protein